jgi:uncharacterized RDD family membrane protein YckC
MATPASATADPRSRAPAGLFRRLAALAYDCLLLLSLLLVATLLALPLTGGQAVRPHNPYFQTYLFLIGFFYFAWHWVRSGQTLGMRAWRIRVVSLDGGPVGWWQALLRFMVGLASLAVVGLGLLWALVDPRRRAWHDLAAGTLVVHEPP